MRVAVPLPKACRLINHGPTTLIASAHGGRRNVMAAAWVMALDFDPPKVAAVIAEGTYTRELVERSGAFALNLPTVAMAGVTYAVGSASGRDEDKFARHALATFPGSTVDVPLVLGCAAGNPHPASGGKLPEQLRRVAAVLVDLGGNGIDVHRGKFPDVLADEFLFLRQPEIHEVPSPSELREYLSFRA